MNRATREVRRLTLRQTWRGAAAVAAAGVLVTVTAVLGFVAAYPDPADRVTLARSIGANPGLTALFGEPRDLATVAGFTEWRVVLLLSLVGAVWAAFAATRVLRGDEESGRAELLLAGSVTRTGATRATVLGLAEALGLLLLLSVAGLALGGARDLGVGPAVLLGVTLVSTPAVMVGVGAVTSQLVDTRRRAVGLAAAVLGLFYVVRVVADSRTDLRWLRWATPLGWLELARPLTGADARPLLLSYGLSVALGLVAIGTVRRRDTGAGLLPTHDTAPARTALLGSPLGLAVRLGRGSAASWFLGMGAFGLLVGAVARTASEAMAKSTGGQFLGQLGLTETGARAYVGILFVLVTLTLMVAAAAQVSATREEESSGRVDALLVRPVGRVRWLAGRLVVALGLLVLAGVATVLGTAVAGAATDLDVAGHDLTVAGVNALPAAVFILGAGTLLHALVPRWAVPLTYGLVAASFLLEIVGSAVRLPGWLLSLSVLHHVAPAPAVDPDWPAAAVLVLLGLLLCAAGAVGFRHRDLAPE